MKAKKTKRLLEISCIRSISKTPMLDQLKEHNIQRLMQSGMIEKFVREMNGSWDHQGWLVLCEKISESDYYPVDLDKVGLLLEKEKSLYTQPSSAVFA